VLPHWQYQQYQGHETTTLTGETWGCRSDASDSGIVLSGLAFYPSVGAFRAPRAQTTAFMEYRPAGAMSRLSP